MAQELGALLGVSPEKAESIAADMILDGRLPGTIDQVWLMVSVHTLHQGAAPRTGHVHES